MNDKPRPQGPVVSGDGYRCLSVRADRRCNLAHGHAGVHRAFSYADGPCSPCWTDADISPPAPSDLQQDLRALSVVVTDIRALLTESNRLLTDMRGDLGEFLTRTPSGPSAAECY